MSMVQISDTLYQQLNHAADYRNSTVDDLAKKQIREARHRLLALANAARQEYLTNGGELLDEEGVLQELLERRGENH